MVKFSSFEKLKQEAWEQSIIIYNSPNKDKFLKSIKDSYLKKDINLNLIDLYLSTINLYLSFMYKKVDVEKGKIEIEKLKHTFNQLKSKKKECCKDNIEDNIEDNITEDILFSQKIFFEFKKQNFKKGTISFNCPICKKGTVKATKLDNGLHAHCSNCGMSILT